MQETRERRKKGESGLPDGRVGSEEGWIEGWMLGCELGC